MLDRAFVSEQQWSSGLDVSNDFRWLAIPDREIVFVQRMLVRGKNSVWQMEEYVFLSRLPSPSHL